MQPRRSLRLVAGALVLVVPILSSCGFGQATDKVYTPGVGTNSRDGVVKVLSAVVASAQSGSGTFLASFSNNSTTDSDSLSDLAGAGEWQDLTIGEIDSLPEIPPQGLVNLADEGGINVSGDFDAGQFVELTLTFENGQSVTMDVPVVYACDEYAGLDTSSGSASPSASSSESASESPGESASAEATEGASASPSETAAASPSATQQTYDCVSAEAG